MIISEINAYESDIQKYMRVILFIIAAISVIMFVENSISAPRKHLKVVVIVGAVAIILLTLMYIWRIWLRSGAVVVWPAFAAHLGT